MLKYVLAVSLLIIAINVPNCVAGYGDIVYSYRGDGIVLCNGEPFFPIGVYYIPCCNQRSQEDIRNLPRETFFQEFAQNGGNLICWPHFHFDLPLPGNGGPRWDDYCPNDVTDINLFAPNDCKEDLEFAEEYGIKIISDGTLAYYWDSTTDPNNFIPPHYLKGSSVDYYGTTRKTNDRSVLFANIHGKVTASGHESSLFAWGNFHEGAWRPWKNTVEGSGQGGTRDTSWEEQLEVYNEMKTLETSAGGSRPIIFEEAVIGIVGDLLRNYNLGCDILGYNVRIFNAPHLANYNYINNKWSSITGDTADVQTWSVDGIKPVFCCVDALDFDYHLPWKHQIRFMSYDAVVHRCTGLTWGACHYIYPFNENYICPPNWYETEIKPIIKELGVGSTMHPVLKSPFDSTAVGVTVKAGEDIIEKSAIVGGDLAPKNHLCSGRYLIEGCLKYYDGNVYLIAACREGRDSVTQLPDNVYTVTFKPFFSGDWAPGYIVVVNEDVGPGQPRTVAVNAASGTFTDTFHGEDVHIYKFAKPARFGE